MSVLELNGRIFDASTTGTLTLTGEGGAATTDVTQGLGKSWANYTSDTTTAYRDSLNFGSITDKGTDRKSTRLNSSHSQQFRMPSSA